MWHPYWTPVSRSVRVSNKRTNLPFSLSCVLTLSAFSVYLPQGVWKDGIDGSLRKGSRWMHGYRVPKDKIAYFRKMPDNTRF